MVLSVLEIFASDKTAWIAMETCRRTSCSCQSGRKLRLLQELQSDALENFNLNEVLAHTSALPPAAIIKSEINAI